MSAETLRKAARQMRDDYPFSTGHDTRSCTSPTCQRRVFHHAVADWLDHEADAYEQHRASETTRNLRTAPALTVARAYLGEGS